MYTIPPAANKYGHSINLAFRSLPELGRELQAVVQSGQWPEFRTQSDVIRTALQQFLRQLANEEPGVIATATTDLMMAVTTAEQEVVELAQTIRSSGLLITSHLEHGRIQDARRVYQSICEALYGMPEGEMKVEGFEVLDKFSHLRQLAPAALRPSEAL